MRRLGQKILLFSALAGSLPAATVLTCSFNGNAFTSAGCYTSPTFFTTDSSDWLSALGAANQSPYYLGTAGTKTFTTGGGLTVGIAEGPGYAGGIDDLLRVDNFEKYFDSGTNTWRDYNASGSPYMNYHIAQSFFDAPPDSGAGIPGDHLLSYENNAGKPLEMQFSQGINGIMFRISTPTSADV